MAKVANIKTKQKLDFDGVFHKIRIDKKTDVPEIIYSLKTDKKNRDIIEKGSGRALDSFLNAMQNLSGVFCEICEFDGKEDDTTITTVNFSQKGGVIISGQVELSNGVPQPLCVNTPHILIEENDKGSYCLSPEGREQLEELKKEAVKYLQGDMNDKQLDMFEDAANG